MGNSLMVMSMAVAGKGSSFLGEGSNFMDIFINFLSMIWDAVGDTLMSVVYFIVKFMLNIVDFLQFFVGKLVGINVWMDGTDVTQLELQDLDIIFRFLYSSEVQRVFKALIIIGAVLLIIFTIIAVVQSEYKTAQGDDKAFKNGKAFVLKRALTAVTLMIFVPIMTIVGILASNAVLASLTKTLNANTTLTFGGQIFVASSYDASRYRYYAMTGSRIPVTYPNAIEVVNPSKTGSGSSYYLVDANGNLTFATGSLKNMEGELADVAYNTWEYNKKYKDFATNWDNSYTLTNVSWKSEEDDATYSAFIVDNATDYKDEYDFSYINKTGDYMNAPNNMYTKTYSTGNTAATYAPIPAEYMVVADFIDYAIEYSQKVYIVNVTNKSIDWSNVPTRYYNIFETGGIREAVEIAVDYREGLYSDVSGRVIYRGNNNANSETQGAQYIYATLEKGKYVPILANQTNSGVAFTSSYLADGYEGVVIARGVFDTNGNPTEIYQVSTDGMEFTDPKYVLANADADSTVEAYVSRVDYNYKDTSLDEGVYYLGISVTYEIDGKPGGTAWYGFNSATAFNSDPTVAMDILSKNSSILSYQTYYEGNILKVKVYDKSRNLTFVLPSNYFSAVPGNGTELESLSFKNINIGDRENIEKNEAEVLTTERYAIDLNFYNINGTKLENNAITLSYTFDNQMNAVDFTNIENVTIGNTDYIRFKLSDDYSLLLDDATRLIFTSAISATSASPEKAVDYLNALFNPEYLYEFNYITTSYTVLPLKEAQENNDAFTYYVYNLASEQIEEAWYDIDLDAIPKADYFISFRRNDIKWGIGFDININGLKFSTWRFHLGLTYDINETSVATLPVDSGMVLNYNFSSSNGILMENLFKPSRINPIVLVFATVLIFKLLGTAVWGMIKRIFDIVIHFIVMPGFVSTIALDDGARFSKWKDGLIKAIFGAYGVILGLNFFFILVPILKDATQIFTAGDLPSSLQGSFVGNSIFANPDVLNNIVYILFLLVAFTLIKSMPSMIAGWFGGTDYVKEGSDVRGAVKANNKAVASFVSGNDAKAAVKNFFSTVTSFFPGSAFYGDKLKSVFGSMKNRAGETFDGMVESFRSRHAGGEGSASAEGRESRSWFRRRTPEEKLAEKEARAKEINQRIGELKDKDFSSLTTDEQKELIQLQKEQEKNMNAIEKYNEQIKVREEKRAKKESDAAAKDAATIAAEVDFNNISAELQKSYAKAMKLNDTAAMQSIERELKNMFASYAKKSPEIGKDKHFLDTMMNRMKAQNFQSQYDYLQKIGHVDEAEALYEEFARSNTFGKKFNKQLREDVNAKRLQFANDRLSKAQQQYNNKNSEENLRALEQAQDDVSRATYMSEHKLSETSRQRIRSGKGPKKLRKMITENRDAMAMEIYGADINNIARGTSSISQEELLRRIKKSKVSSTMKKDLKAQVKRATKSHKTGVDMTGAIARGNASYDTLKAAREAISVQKTKNDVINNFVKANGTIYTADLAKMGVSQDEFERHIGKGSYLNANFAGKRALRKAYTSTFGSVRVDKHWSKEEREARKNQMYGKVVANEVMRDKEFAKTTKETLRNEVKSRLTTKKLQQEMRAVDGKYYPELNGKKAIVDSHSMRQKDLESYLKEYSEKSKVKADLSNQVKAFNAQIKQTQTAIRKAKNPEKKKELEAKLESLIARRNDRKVTGEAAGKALSAAGRQLKKLAKQYGMDSFNLGDPEHQKKLNSVIKQSVDKAKAEYQKMKDSYDKEVNKLKNSIKGLQQKQDAMTQKMKEAQRAADSARWSGVKTANKEKESSTASSESKKSSSNSAKRRDTGGAGNAGMK